MKIQKFWTKPVVDEIWAVRYDGTIDIGDLLVKWVRESRNAQRLYFEGVDGRLVLHGPEGTSDLFEGWWLVKSPQKNFFFVLTTAELEEQYQARKPT